MWVWPPLFRVLFVMLSSPSAPAATAGVQQQLRLNVLFMAIDDLRFQLRASGPGVAGPGSCSLLQGGACNGMVTPNFDALANISTVFTKNYVQHAVCSCSRTSLLTSRRPDATRVWDLYSYWRDVSGNYTSIHQWFREQGYHSVGGGKVYHPGHASGFNASLGRGGDDMGAGAGARSWSEAYYHAPNLDYWSSSNGSTGRFRAGASWAAVPPEVEAVHPLPDSQVAANAVATLKRFAASGLGTAGNTPFFLAVGFQ
jgi:iduronate 2-sulfatase